jgi:hypothetical protein
MIAALKKRVAKLEGPRGGGCDDSATILLYDSEGGRVLAASCSRCGAQHRQRVQEALDGRGVEAVFWIPHDRRGEVPAATRWEGEAPCSPA